MMHSKHLTYTFIHLNPMWVDVPAFMKFIKGEPKGFVYKTCTDVLKIIDKDWIMTIHCNTNQSYNNFRKIFKTLNIQNNIPVIDRYQRNEKFKRNAGCSYHINKAQGEDEAQGWADIFKIPKHIGETSAHINGSADAIQRTCDNIAEISDRAKDFVHKFNEIYQQFSQGLSDFTQGKGPIVSKFLAYLAKFISLAFLIHTFPGEISLSQLVALFTLIIPIELTDCIPAIAAGLIRVIKGMSGRNEAHEGDDQSFITSFFTLTVGIMKGLFTEIPKETFDHLHISARKVKLISDYIKGVSTIYEFVVKLLEKILDIIGDKLLLYYGYIPWFMKSDEITPLIDEFLQYKQLGLDTKATINIEASRKTVALHDKLIKLENKLVKKLVKDSGNIKILPYLRIMIKHLDAVIARIPAHMRTGLAPRRIKPFWVYIYGDPRIGKSAVFQPFVVNELARAMNLISNYEDYTNYTYLRNCGEDYWENYDNHPVLWYNDLFQNYAQDEAMHKAVLELTNVVDDNVYPLEMAFERKHSVYFNSQVIVSNAQNDIIGANFIRNKCWSGGLHLFARRDISVKITIADKYAKNNDVGIDMEKMYNYMVQNPQNCVGYEFCVDHTAEEYAKKLLFPKDLYVLEFTDKMNGNFLKKTDILSGIKLICDEAKKYASTQGLFKDKLYQYFEDRWTKAQADEEFYEAEQGPEELWLETKLEPVYRAVHEQLTEMCGTDIEYVQRFRTNRDTHELLRMYYAGVMDPDDDMSMSFQAQYPGSFVRLSIAVEAAGTAYWEGIFDNMSRWEKFCLNFKSQINKIRLYFTHLLNVTSNRWIYLYAVLKLFLKLYIVFRLAKFYFNFISIYWIQGSKPPHAILCANCQHTVACAAVGNVDLADTAEVLTNKKKFMIERVPTKPKQEEHTREKYIPDVATAQTIEAKQKIVTNQITRVKKDAGSIAQSYDTQNTIVENIINKQMCKFSFEVHDQDGVKRHERMYCSGLCLGSDIFVLPYHIWYRIHEMNTYWKEHGMSYHLFISWNDKVRSEVAVDNISAVKLGYTHTEDLAYIRIKNFVQKPHIKKFFVNVADRPVLFEMYLHGLRGTAHTLSTLSVTNGEYTTGAYIHDSVPDPMYGGKFATREIVVPLCVKYWNCPTIPGDCGLVLMHTDSSLNCKKILGMHTAGNTAHQTGFTSLIFQEDIDEVFKHFYPNNDSISSMAMEYTPAEGELPDKLREMGFNVLGELPRLVVPEYNIDKKVQMTMPRKSKISKSVVYDIMSEDFGPSTVAPARLRPFDVGDERISPLFNAMKKLPKQSPYPHVPYINDVVDHLGKTYLSMKSNYPPHILTDDEVVNGWGLVQPIELSTSAGYPYVSINNTSGKHPFFERYSEYPHRYKMGDYVYQQFREREALAKQGIIKETYFIDTLKDEPRPLEKVAIGKTRLFQVAPVDLNLLIRKYFGAFLSHCQADFIIGECSVGINANSLEWTELAKHHLKVGNTHINGDGSNYDASLSQPLSMEDLRAVNMWYRFAQKSEWLPEHDMVRFVIYATVLNSKHICVNIVYQLWQGNKSGISITAQFNSQYGQITCRIAYVEAGYDLQDFINRVVASFYGDDDFISVDAKKCPNFTCSHYKKILARFGIEYTSATKDEVVETWYTLDQVSYLKRAFYWNGLMYLPRLDYHVILEIPRWSESDPYNMNDQLNRFNSALLEISNYGEQEFQSMYFKFMEYCALLNARGSTIKANQLFTFAYCERVKFGENYSNDDSSILSRDRVITCGKSDSVLYVGGDGDVKLPTRSDLIGLHSDWLYKTAQSQTNETKMKSSTNQIVRTKAQGDELQTEAVEDILDCYLIINRNIEQMKPCFDAFSRSMARAFKKRETRVALSMLHVKVQALIHIYKECLNFVTCDGDEAQSGEYKQQDFIPRGFSSYSMGLRPVRPNLHFCGYRNVLSEQERAQMLQEYQQLKSEIEANEAQGDEPLPQRGVSQIEKMKQYNLGIQELVNATTVPEQANTEDQVVEKKNITVEVNQNAPHQPPVEHNTVPRMRISNLFTEHENYFKRPVVIKTWDWVTTDTMWKSLQLFHFPRDYVTLQPIKNKLAMVKYYRPDFEFEVLVNATRFHYGRLVWVVKPLAYITDPNDATKVKKTLPDCTDNVYNSFTWPHWYQISAGVRQSLKFTVPYRCFVPILEMDKSQWQNKFLFTLECIVAVPLTGGNSAASSTAPPVDVTLMCRMIEPRFSGFVASDSAQGEQEILSKEGLVTKPILGSSTQRVVSGTLTGASKVTQDLAYLAYSAGYSTPPNLNTTNSMQIRQPLMNKIDDVPNTIVLGPSQAAKVIASREYVNSEADDMNINYIIGHPSLRNTYKITSSTEVGDSFMALTLNPLNMYFEGEGYTRQANTYSFTPLGYLAQYFGLWRGSFKITFSVVASAFHSARFRIYYIPGGMSVPSVPAKADGLRVCSQYRNVIWDINETTDITIECPFDTVVQWCRTKSDNYANSGVVGMQLINKLTSADPTAVVSPIYIQVFVSACDDFQFSAPFNRASDADIQLSNWGPDAGPASAQGEEVSACGIPSSSSTCLREQKGILMGDVDTKRRHYHDNVCMPYTSVKELMGQLTMIEKFKNTTTDVISGRKYCPYGTGYNADEYGKWDSFWWNSPFHTLMVLFRFVRGSFRTHILANDKLQMSAYVRDDPMVQEVCYQVVNQANDVLNGDQDVKRWSYGAVQVYDNSVFPLDVITPWNSAYSCTLTWPMADITADREVPIVITTVSVQKAVHTMIFGCSAGDDFIAGYRIGVPRIRWDKPPPAFRSMQHPTALVQGHEYMYRDGDWHPIKWDDKAEYELDLHTEKWMDIRSSEHKEVVDTSMLAKLQRLQNECFGGQIDSTETGQVKISLDGDKRKVEHIKPRVGRSVDSITESEFEDSD